MKYLILCAFAAIATLGSCEKDRITGSGAIATETRSVSGFTGIEVEGTSAVNVRFDANFSVIVKAYKNLMPYLETVKVGDRLKVRYRNGVSVNNDNAEIFVTLPTLQKFSLTGNTNATIQPGQTAFLETSITGNGKIDAIDFVATEATASITGNGIMRIGVANILTANITGNGVVYYRGSPQVTTSITGNGRVERQ